MRLVGALGRGSGRAANRNHKGQREPLSISLVSWLLMALEPPPRTRAEGRTLVV